MSSLEEIRESRLQKLALLKERGVDPYPVTTEPDTTLKSAAENFDELSSTGEAIVLAGRITSVRGQGKLVFITIHDGTGKFQALLKSGEPTPAELVELFNEAFDIGDFVEVTGKLFVTQKGEKTIIADNIRMLAKSLRPLPEKWHGLSDVEERFRKRYLDLISNEGVRERFVMRTKLISEIRRILDEAGFLEVETPALQPVYGGASAEPFVTHHNTLDTDLYLRISDELYLKRLLAGGFPKVYEIARDFRNEGIDTTHNPEFTMLEFYEAYSDAPRQRAFVERMLKTLVKNLYQREQIEWEGETIDFSGNFLVRPYYELLREAGVEDPKGMKPKELDTIYKEKVRSRLIQPTFIVDYPEDMLPLAKKKDGEEGIVDAFQLVVGGVELVKAFSELNDPVDQRARFEKQQQFAKAGDKEAQQLDEDFLEAMEYGIPPAGGVGIGIDRLTMLFTGVSNIKEVILFPTLRPKA